MSDNEYIIDITSNVDITPISELSSQLEEVSNKATEVSEALNITGTDSLENVTYVAEEASSSLEQTASSAETVTNSINNIDPDGLKNVSDTSLNASESIINASDSSDLLSAALSSMTSISLSSFLNEAAKSADTVNQGFTRVGLNLSLSGDEMAKTKTIMSNLRSETSRTGDEIRTYFSSMGLAGVKNARLLNDSFKMVSGTAFLTNNSLSSVSESVKKMVVTNKIGARQLLTLGLSTDTVSKAMNRLGYNVGNDAKSVSDAFAKMDDETQLRVLSTSMSLNNAGKAGKEFSNTFEGTLNNLNASLGAIIRNIGEGVVIVLKPAMEAIITILNGLVNAFKSLPGPVQNLIKGFFGLVSILLTAFSLFISFRSVLKLLDIRGAINSLKSLKNTFKIVSDGVSKLKGSISSLKTGFLKVKEGVAGFIKFLKGLNLAQIRATISNWALAISEWAVSLPILIIVGLIALLIGSLVYLYYNNETVRDSINNLGSMILKLGEWIKNGLLNALNFLITLPGKIKNILTNIVNKTLAWGNNIVNIGKSKINSFVNTIISFLKSLPAKIYNTILSAITRVKSWGGSLLNTGRAYASNFINSIVGVLRSLPSRVYSAIVGVIGKVGSVFRQAWNTASSYINKIKSKIPGLHAGWYGESERGNGEELIQKNLIDDKINPLINNINQNRNINNIKDNVRDINITINGIIEEKASDYIIKTITHELRRENLISGN